MADLVTVKSHAGQLGTVDSSQLDDALKHGFSVASPDEIQGHNDELEYGGGALNPLATAAESAASAATFGVSRHLENLTGLTTPEAQAARQKYNPISSAAGTVGGILYDPLGAVGAVGKVGGRVSEGAAKLLGEASPTAGLAAKILKAAPAAAAGSAVEGAAFGLGQSVDESALGDPDAIGEKLLSNVGYGALLGGALGSTLKAGELAIPQALTKAKESASGITDKLLGASGEVGPLGKAYAKASSFISGKDESSILEALKGRQELVDNPEAREKIAQTFAGDLQDHIDKVNEAARKTNMDIRPEEVQKTLSAMPVEQAGAHAEPIKNRIEESIAEMEAHPALYPQNVVYKIKGLRDEFMDQVEKAETSGDVYSAINELKQNLDKQGKIFGKAISPEYADTANNLKSLRYEIKSNLENEEIWGQAAARQSGFNQAQTEHLFSAGKGSEFQKAFLVPVKTKTGAVKYEVSPSKVKTFFTQINDARGAQKAEALQSFISSSKGLVDQIDKSYAAVPAQRFDRSAVESVIDKNSNTAQAAIKQAELQKNLGMLGGGGHNAYLGEGAAIGIGAYHPVLGAGIEAFNLARNPGLAIQRLAKIEKLANQTTDIISRTAKSIFKRGTEGLEKNAGVIGAKLAPQNISSGKAAAGNDKHEDTFAKLNELQSSPEQMINTLQQSTDALHAHAPKIAQGVQAAATRGTEFLASKIPQTGPQLALSPKPLISKSELARFQRYYTAVNEPMSVMKQINDCTVTPEGVEAIKTVYPSLFSEMNQSLLEAATDHISKFGIKAIPFKKKMALSLFTGQDLDSALSQPTIAANQVAYQPQGSAPQASGPAQPKSQGSLSAAKAKNIDLKTPLLTAQQKSSQRIDG